MCPRPAAARPTARLDGPVRVATLLSSTPLTADPLTADPLAADTRENPAPRDLPAGAGESPIAVLTAEIALLHARLDDLQSRLDK